MFPLSVLIWIGKRVIARTTEMGSRTLVAAASAGVDMHGIYMADCKFKEPSKWVRSAQGNQAQKKFYVELLGSLEVIQPGITNYI